MSLVQKDYYEENRNNGRGDFQLLYVVEGEPVYTINGQSLQATAGTLILYKPYESQKYIYPQKKHLDLLDPLFGTEFEQVLTNFPCSRPEPCISEFQMKLLKPLKKLSDICKAILVITI